MSSGLAAWVAGWAPQPVESVDTIDPWALDAFAAMLDLPAPVAGPGEPVPPLWHWLAFLDHPARAELGEDGHPARGRFLPPVPDRRRMIAGGRLEVRAPLRVGEPVLRRSALTAVTAKHGRSGEMLFVTVRHEFREARAAAGPPLLVETQDVVYRSRPTGTVRVPVDEPGGPPDRPGGLPVGAWQIVLDPDEALLFRFSALTYNTHRIHYDQAYARDVEGHPGLVVHGPLLALLLLELPRRFAPGRMVRGFSFRLDRPTFVGRPVLARREPDGELVAGVPGRVPAIRATVRLE